MSYPINYPTPQNANVQIFRGGDASTTAHIYTRDWVKPQGASFVWFTLIGAGGGGSGCFVDSGAPQYYPGGGGASGNVTNFMCPAFLLPDILQVTIGKGGAGSDVAVDVAPANGSNGTSTQIQYIQKNNSGYTLLAASGGSGAIGLTGYGTGGFSAGVDPITPMTAAGFYNSTAGQNGADGNQAIGTNGSIFVMGGNGYNYASTVIASYYGYQASLKSGYSQLSPIPLSIPNVSTTDSGTGKSISQSFGCGGNGGGEIFTGGTASNGGRGGDGLAIIVTW